MLNIPAPPALRHGALPGAANGPVILARVPLHSADRPALCTTYSSASARSTWTPTKYQLFAHVWIMLPEQVFHLTTNYFSEGEVTRRRMDAAQSRRPPGPMPT
jgi:hypothetical protein